ncbi:MAG: hypothetical protein EAX89_08175 [Candidatus Lokiarchaeota archaeon]|nr:hypothetical protein [Candidatus Lokiarchaeota archaeon]
MAEEFANFMQETRKAPLEEKLNAFGDIVERMMSMLLRIPDLLDQTLSNFNQKISSIESKMNNMNNDLAALKTRGGGGAAPVIASPSAPISVPPPSSGPPGGPPGGPPPPPGGPPGSPGPQRPANPQSLRGAIMGELKQLFAKRQSQQ